MIADGTIGGRDTIALTRMRDRFVAVWEKREVPDAGPDLLPVLTGLEVAVLDAHGALVSRETIPAPADLARRKGSVAEEGVVLEDGATLVHWVQTTTTTDDDGRVRTAARLEVSYAGNIFENASSECSHCNLTVAFASLGDETVAIVRTEPDIVVPVLGVPPPPPKFVALHLHRDRNIEPEEIPWLVPSPAGTNDPQAPGLEMAVDALGRIVVTTDGSAWLVDRSLHLLGGPIALPSADARIAWGPSNDAASIAWSVSPFTEGRSSVQNAKREVFVSPHERLSPGRQAVAIARNGNDVGVLFESANRLLFGDADDHGGKNGGDVLVRMLGDGTVSSEYGSPRIQEQIELLARGSGAFTAVTFGSGALTRTEIVCAR